MRQCLAAEDLLAYDADARRYSFGRLAYDIGMAAAERLDLAQLCRPALARIADDTGDTVFLMVRSGDDAVCADRAIGSRSEEHTSELQSLMRISYAVFCLKKKTLHRYHTK